MSDDGVTDEARGHRGRSNADELLAAALASGRTAREAATLAGVSERTVSRRLHDPAFQARVRELRAAAVTAAAGRLADGMTEAADVLRSLLGSADENVRHKAASKLIELGIRVREVVDLEQRVEELERLLKSTEAR